jgi:hypothetical protein
MLRSANMLQESSYLQDFAEGPVGLTSMQTDVLKVNLIAVGKTRRCISTRESWATYNY